MKRSFGLFVLAQRPLLLGVLHDLLLHVEAFTAADTVHVLERLVLRVRLLTKVQVFFFCGGNPVGITADHLAHRRASENVIVLAFLIIL